ncbi:hypothetical protein [Streptomyces mirabilis]
MGDDRAGGRRADQQLRPAAGTTVGLPAELIGAGTDPVTGPATSPEVRLLVAHASLLHDTIGDLTRPGVDAARNALIELARGVVHRYVDGTEPALGRARPGRA